MYQTNVVSSYYFRKIKKKKKMALMITYLLRSVSFLSKQRNRNSNFVRYSQKKWIKVRQLLSKTFNFCRFIYILQTYTMHTAIHRVKLKKFLENSMIFNSLRNHLAYNIRKNTTIKLLMKTRNSIEKLCKSLFKKTILK